MNMTENITKINESLNKKGIVAERVVESTESFVEITTDAPVAKLTQVMKELDYSFVMTKGKTSYFMTENF